MYNSFPVGWLQEHESQTQDYREFHLRMESFKVVTEHVYLTFRISAVKNQT